MSGEQIYYRHYLRLLGSAGFIQDMRVGSFNTGSGAFVGAQTLATTIFSGMPYEVHRLVSPSDKDAALDAVISGVRELQERYYWSIDGMHIYSMNPTVDIDIVAARYYSNPNGSLDKGEGQFAWWKFVKTINAHELRVSPSMPASYQLVIDVIVAPSLAADDLATVNLESDDLVIWGAAARCYWMAGRGAPAQETALFDQQRREAAREYSRLSANFKPKITRKPQLDSLY